MGPGSGRVHTVCLWRLAPSAPPKYGRDAHTFVAFGDSSHRDVNALLTKVGMTAETGKRGA